MRVGESKGPGPMARSGEHPRSRGIHLALNPQSSFMEEMS